MIRSICFFKGGRWFNIVFTGLFWRTRLFDPILAALFGNMHFLTGRLLLHCTIVQSRKIKNAPTFGRIRACGGRMSIYKFWRLASSELFFSKCENPFKNWCNGSKKLFVTAWKGWWATDRCENLFWNNGTAQRCFLS